MAVLRFTTATGADNIGCFVLQGFVCLYGNLKLDVLCILLQVEQEQDLDTAEVCVLEFNSNHSKNIERSNANLTATRVCSYNHGIVTSHKPLPRGHAFKVSKKDVSCWH